ncbi:MAG: type IV/VI secretion system ImpK/VasF family protein [Neolewinella sp.]|jgi:type IV/VI secretion system ImpK/VasF family protein
MVLIMSTSSQRLQDACASLFLFLATFRRNAKTSQKELAGLRAGLEAELAKVAGACTKDQDLAPLWERVRYALVTTADQVILSSPWANRAGWSMQLQEAEVYGSREGGKRFFQLVQQALDDASKDGPLLAQVLFHCMGLGFQGELRNDRPELQRIRQQLFEKAQLPSQMTEKLTPDSYDRNSAKSALKLPSIGIARLVLVGLAAIVFALLAGGTATSFADGDLADAINAASEKLDKLNEPR